MKPIPKFVFEEFNNEASQIFWSGSTKKREARKGIAWIVKVAHLKKGNSILEMACGNGRHSVEFAKKGIVVDALDCCRYQIHLARKNVGSVSNVGFRIADI